VHTSPGSTPSIWHYAASRQLPLDRPRIMAILNITPDSFFDGGSLTSPASALAAALRAVADGADLLDIGGESTRPGAPPIPPDEQQRRIIPVISAIRDAGLTIPISIDTTLAPVASAALSAGANIINDISAGRDDADMLPLAAATGAGLILMHRPFKPASDRYSDRYAAAQKPAYDDVVADVASHLASRAAAALAAGVPRESILLDPGLGFGKSVDDNLALIRSTPVLLSLGYPILSALSRKSFVGRISLDRDSTPDERLPGTLALSILHHQAGARVFRVHDVAQHRQALAACHAINVLGCPAPPL
jgi:dihydropteroate synthase